MSVATDPGPRVVIADDQTLVRGGFRLILGAAGIPVVAEAADGREAVAAALKHRPDVVLMDYRMPGLNGAEATRAVLEASPGTNVVCLSASVTRQEIEEVLAAGAVACVTKDQDFDKLVATIRAAAGR